MWNLKNKTKQNKTKVGKAEQNGSYQELGVENWGGAVQSTVCNCG